MFIEIVSMIESLQDLWPYGKMLEH